MVATAERSSCAFTFFFPNTTPLSYSFMQTNKLQYETHAGYCTNFLMMVYVIFLICLGQFQLGGSSHGWRLLFDCFTNLVTSMCLHPDQTPQWSSSTLCHQTPPLPLAVRSPLQGQPAKQPSQIVTV